MFRSGFSIFLAALATAGCGSDLPIVSDGPPAIVEVEPREVTPALLRAAVDDPRVRRFYEARSWAPAWTAEQARALTAAFAEADRHAIDRRHFWDQPPAGAPAAEREAALTLGAIRYADALATGVTDPTELWDIYSVPRNRADLIGGLQRAVEAGQLQPWLASLAPNDVEYEALSRAYLRMRELAARERVQTVPGGEAISPGDRDPRVPAIVERLRWHGYLPAASPPPEPKQGEAERPQPDPQLYTDAMAAGVARLQEDQDIEPDGIIGPETVEALNLGAVQRGWMLAVNLERRRWLQRHPPATRIDVNTAGAFLDYWRDGRPIDRRRVVVGQPGWETPQLGSPLERLVANPPWNVPDSIAEEEILPKGSGYMARNNMRFVNGRIVQAPGPDSALGLVKLDLDNPHAIYLHDTPAKALFAASERHASHGCTRVHEALQFARMIADQQGVRDAFERGLASGDERAVNLRSPIPVRFLYHTVHLDGGRLVFRHDDYGWDERVARALGLRAASRPLPRRYQSDVGP